MDSERPATDAQKRKLYALLREGSLTQKDDGPVTVEGLPLTEASRLISVGEGRRRTIGFSAPELAAPQVPLKIVRLKIYRPRPKVVDSHNRDTRTLLGTFLVWATSLKEVTASIHSNYEVELGYLVPSPLSELNQSYRDGTA